MLILKNKGIVYQDRYLTALAKTKTKLTEMLNDVTKSCGKLRMKKKKTKCVVLGSKSKK